jgi:hypothetical protein
MVCGRAVATENIWNCLYAISLHAHIYRVIQNYVTTQSLWNLTYKKETVVLKLVALIVK